MLTIRKENFREDEINVILDGLVPKNHLVRKIENAIDFSFIYDKVKDLYSPLGAPSIDPVVLIKIVLIQYLFGIPSMRQTIREIEVNVAYRWFLGYSLTEKIPHFSTFNKNYERRFKNTDLFESIFKEILARATKCGFVDSSNIYIDVYDEYYDCYICPNNKILKYSTTNRDGYREYKSNPSDCKSCEYLNICTNSKNKQKLVTRHIWQNYLEEADHLRHKPYVKKVYSKRKETIERVFADAKEKHGMRYTKLRGLSKIKIEVSLIFSCMNLKKLANWMWKDTSNNLRLTPIFSILSLKIFIKKKIAIL